jgi:hypothetical protein
MRATRPEEIRIVCTDSDRERKAITTAKRGMMTGHARRIPITTEGLAEEQLAPQHGERVIDTWKLESGRGISGQSMRLDRAA